MNDPSKVESILLAALEKATAEERTAYLDAECKGNPALRENVDRLLAAHSKAVNFLEKPSAQAGEQTSAYVPLVEKSGTIIAGRYKLLERIGEGGMGEVWVADQLEPIKRRIAVKLIKPGMDSRSVLARFEAERQALALMDHPNIAKVLDAGTTADGRPFFVMELVKGTPITEFCDARKLTPKQRLELFIPVCQAIQHAHTKGIIHRDIKPSNVLVALHDERQVPKVIDFGVAKAVGQQLTDNTIYTGFGSLVGTPAYMAPEQATFNQLDVDTRADVYALGILLYEILAGSPPLEPERFKKAALDEVLRIIREDDPPRPSQRLSSSEMKVSIAAVRGSEPAKLTAQIQGELDWIVMKALEKDRVRRYDSATALSKDIENFLNGEAVLAHPPSTTYRLEKFARKHFVGLATAAIFAGMLTCAAILSSWLAFRASLAEGIAEANAKKAEDKADEAELYVKLFRETAEEQMIANYEKDLVSVGLQLDNNALAEKNDHRVGLLRRLKLREQLVMHVPELVTWKMKGGLDLRFELPKSLSDQYRAMEQFITAATIVRGQEFAPLLPPITHDGIPVQQSDRQTSPNQQTLLTRGNDGSVRLWDIWTARQIAVLRQEREKIVDHGYNADGLTAFTLDDTGIIRFWDSTNGRLRFHTQLPSDLYAKADNEALEKEVRETQLDLWHPKTIDRNECFIVGKDRMITRHVVVKQRPDTGNVKVFDQLFSGPVELWDTTTGRFVAKLDIPDANIERLYFLGDGRWITSWRSPSTEIVFAAADGRAVSQFTPPNDGYFGHFEVSPSHQTLISKSWSSDIANRKLELAFWDTRSWTRNYSIPIIGLGDPDVRFLNDELFALGNHQFWHIEWSVREVFNPATQIVIVNANRRLFPPVDRCILQETGAVIDTTTRRRLEPSPGRRFHPAITKFAEDGRFVVGCGTGNNDIIDTLTERQIDATIEGNPVFKADIGYAWAVSPANQQETFIRRFPLAVQLGISSEQLELWAQVAVRGELSPEGEFVKWNEETWEQKRQKLAELPASQQNFPFPGYVATDKLHWIRAEYYSTETDADKLRLASELLRRAEENGDQNEATRWRAEIERSSSPKGEKN